MAAQLEGSRQRFEKIADEVSSGRRGAGADSRRRISGSDHWGGGPPPPPSNTADAARPPVRSCHLQHGVRPARARCSPDHSWRPSISRGRTLLAHGTDERKRVAARILKAEEIGASSFPSPICGLRPRVVEKRAPQARCDGGSCRGRVWSRTRSRALGICLASTMTTHQAQGISDLVADMTRPVSKGGVVQVTVTPRSRGVFAEVFVPTTSRRRV